jgi:hypothetical protein
MREKQASEYLEKNGYGVIHPSQFRIDMESDFLLIWEKVKDFTMISPERGYSIFKSVEYIVQNKIPGDFAECGVWKGGSCMLIAYSLQYFGITDKKIYMYDTYSGMTEPDENDCIASTGENIYSRWEKSRDNKGMSMWASALDEVKENMKSTSYSENSVVFVEGDVIETLKTNRPDTISLLRLDTDWYESTKAELEYLYPLLSSGGTLIIDDYGHFTGSKKAVDEYFTVNRKILLNRIDYTGRTGVKI